MSNHETSPEYAVHAESAEKVALAEKFLRVAEEATEPIDRLFSSSEAGAVSLGDLVKASQAVRRIVFNRACDILGLTDEQRREAFDNF